MSDKKKGNLHFDSSVTMKHTAVSSITLYVDHFSLKILFFPNRRFFRFFILTGGKSIFPNIVSDEVFQFKFNQIQTS